MTATWTPTGETAAQPGDGANRDRASEAGDLPALMGRWTDGTQKLAVCTETKMNFPLWRYGAYAFAATLCLAAVNVAWAWSLDDGSGRLAKQFDTLGQQSTLTQFACDDTFLTSH